jgi:hypothetical protein
MKTEEYLKSNPIVNNFINEVNTKIETYYKTKLSSLRFEPVIVEIGNKFIKISHNTSVWGFISRIDGNLKGAPIRKGDLLKPASWRAPAKHARGNIIDGTQSYDTYGPSYMR